MKEDKVLGRLSSPRLHIPETDLGAFLSIESII